MPARPALFARLLGGVLLAASVTVPAAAERWRALGPTRVNGIVQTSYRLDLDAIRQEGDFLTYRVEITYPDHPRRGGERVLSTSMIDCRNGLRQHLATTIILPDGTARESDGGRTWHKLAPHEIGFGIRNDYCAPAAGSAPR